MLSAPIPAVRDRVFDACPGVVTLHAAADGGLARIRVPGGLMDGHQWRMLSEASAALGDGNLRLTARGNVEIRGVTDGRALSEALATAGLRPSVSHDRVRNVLASPLSGLDDSGIADITSLIAELDHALLGADELRHLPGRFLFGLDDGRADIASLRPDVWLRALSPAALALHVGDLVCADPVPWNSAVNAVIRAASAFVRLAAETSSTPAWRIRELPGAARAIISQFGAAVPISAVEAASRVQSEPLPYGPVAERCVVVGVPLGQVSSIQALAVASAAQRCRQLRITPWRSIVLAHLPADQCTPVLAELAAAGLSTDADSPWRAVSACTGQPGCAKALADVRADAFAVHSRLSSAATVHWSGCARRCGRPSGTFVDVLATPSGYEVIGAAGNDADRATIGSAVSGL